MLVSVIIPAYNVEKFLQKCLDSVFALPLREDEMEVLVIDDGSTDGTAEILAQNAEVHSNLRLFYQENQGQSVARNLGIEEAKGDYIFFVDSDDALTTPCPLPVEAMNSGKYDMIGMETLFEDSDGTQRRYCRQQFPIDEEFATCREYLKTHNVLGIVYGYLFRTSFIKQHAELRFTPGIYHQDEEFIVKAFCLGGPFVYKQGYTYIYYRHEGSSIHTMTQIRQQRLMNDYVRVLEGLTAMSDYRSDMQYKLSWIAVDMLRLLIRQGHDEVFARQILSRLQAFGLYPLPWMADFRYLTFRCLTATPAALCWCIRHWKLFCGKL